MEAVKVNTEIAITFIAYSALMLFIGLYLYKKNKSTEDYLLGGGSLGPVVSALSAGVSDMSGWLLMGLPGALYVSGFVESYIAMGLSIGAFLNWVFIAKRPRIYTSVIASSITIPDYFGTRSDDDKHILRIVCAVVILVFFILYVPSGLVGGAKLFESIFGIDYTHALTTGTIIIVPHTSLGGYKAVYWTDMIQGLLMMSVLTIAPLVMLSNSGGYEAAISIVQEIKPQDLSMGEGVSLLTIMSALAWGSGYFGQPHILVRFTFIHSTKEIPAAMIVGISWMVTSLIGVCFIGILGIAYVYKSNPTLQDPEKIFIVMNQLFFNPWIAGILLSATLAAIMSTVSSQLLVSSSALAEDFYRRTLKQDASSQMVMRLGRIGILSVALIAFLTSTGKNSSVLSIVAYAWAGFGASLGSIVFFSLFRSKMTRTGAIAGMVTGAVVAVVQKNYLAGILNFPIYEIMPGFVCANLVITIVSLMTKVRLGTQKTCETMLKSL